MDIQVLQILWFILIGVLLIGYSILDGFDLGIGALLPFLAKNDREKERLMTSIGPVWDGNEVWLLTGGGALFAAFPHAYATVFSGFYLALMLVLLALIFRAASFEFYAVDDNKKLWSTAFFLGSLVPALLFGVALGNVMNGIPMEGKNWEYTGSTIGLTGVASLDRFLYLLRPFPLAVGLLGLTAILMQGSLYAMVKTDGDIHSRAKAIAGKLWIAYFAILGVTTLLAALCLTNAFVKPISWSGLAVVVAAMLLVKKFINDGKDFGAFIMSSVAFAGLWIMTAGYLFPNLVINTLTDGKAISIHNASSSQLTLTVMLIIALIGVPIMLAYTVYVYRIFKGKIKS